MTEPEGFEFRPANNNEMAEFRRIEQYVFAGTPPADDDPEPPIRPEWTQCAFAGDAMAAISGAYPFIVRLNGNTAPMHGVTAVGTDPNFRRRGLVRKLITDLLYRGREEGQVGSILLASMGAIYQRFGYGQACALAGYEFDPRDAVLREPMPVVGETRLLGKEEAAPHLKSVFKRYVANRNMMALRHDVIWDRLLGDVAKGKAWCAVHFDGEGTPDGYVIYRTRWPQRLEFKPPQEMNIIDLAYADMPAYGAIWAYLRSHDLVGKITWIDVPEDDPAPGLLLEPRCLNRRVWDGLWLRPIDVDGLLTARRYDLDGDVVIRVTGDELCPWNNGTRRLSVRDGAGHVEATDDEPDIVTRPNEFASIVSGFSKPTWLFDLGRVDGKQERLAVVDSLMATRHRPALSFDF